MSTLHSSVPVERNSSLGGSFLRKDILKSIAWEGVKACLSGSCVNGADKDTKYYDQRNQSTSRSHELAVRVLHAIHGVLLQHLNNNASCSSNSVGSVCGVLAIIRGALCSLGDSSTSLTCSRSNCTRSNLPSFTTQSQDEIIVLSFEDLVTVRDIGDALEALCHSRLFFQKDVSISLEDKQLIV